MHKTVSTTLCNIWKSHIEHDYRAELIASERELQACIYFHLRKELSSACAASIRILVEPTIRDSIGIRQPDMLIVAPSPDASHKSMQIIAVLELKLDRGKFIVYQGEIERIERLGGSLNPVRMENQRPHSDAQPCMLTIDGQTQYFIGCIGSSEAAGVDPEEIRAGSNDFAIRKQNLALQTTILYGQIHLGGATKFGAEKFIADQN